MTSLFTDSLFAFILALGASIIGSICGIGGGLIIKPALDLTTGMPVDVVSFLSGCTVLSMSVVSVLRTFLKGGVKIDLKVSTPLAIGALAGGTVGQAVFQFLTEHMERLASVGAIQTTALLATVIGTLIYTLNERKIRTYRIRSVIVCLLAGLCLGTISAFIGIGGGPVNIVVLSFFFSMGTKEAAINSLYLIMFAQAASFFHVVSHDAIPAVNFVVLAVMICGGVAGAIAGARINKRLTPERVRTLFILLMCGIVVMNSYNLYMFLR